MEDLLGLSSSLRDSEFFKDLEGGIVALQSAASTGTAIPDHKTVSAPANHQTSLIPECHVSDWSAHPPLNTHSHTVKAPSSSSWTQPADDPGQSFVVTQLSPKSLPGCIIDSRDSSGPAVGVSLTIDLNGLLGSMESAKTMAGSEIGKEQINMDLDGEPDLDSFPILVRSMSTSRRHSWGVPVSPINLGRRLSLDTNAMDSDGDRDEDEDRDDSLFKSTELQTISCTACPDSVQGDEPDGPKLKVPCPRARVTSMAPGAAGRHLFSRSDILATDQHSRAAHVSHVVQTSKRAARAAEGGEELDPEESLHSTEGQCHM